MNPIVALTVLEYVAFCVLNICLMTGETAQQKLAKQKEN